ncbi:MAG: DUF4296 domain-containing protein [Bacteroidia bacterium]|nr:DUF4296 domain-containing protein [Bacteroidia bacterium]
MKNAGIILLLILVFGCERFNKPKKPKDLIPRTEMVNILYDMYLINSAKGVNVTILEQNGVKPESYILTKHNIDSLQFAQSNTYYAYDTEGYDQLIEDVRTKITLQKNRYETQLKQEEEEQKRKRDSLRDARKKALQTSTTNPKPSN